MDVRLTAPLPQRGCSQVSADVIPLVTLAIVRGSRANRNQLIKSAQHIRRRISEMKRAAIGVRMHSGWGALVAVSNSAGTPEVIDRRRIAIVTPGTPGANQPYHFAENFELLEAEKFLENCFAASQRLALAALRDVVTELRDRHY